MPFLLPFANRSEAGALLAEELSQHHLPKNTVVLGMARGGVPVAYEVAKGLGLELDTVVARKLGVPWQPELAMGAIAGTARVLHLDLIRELEITPEDVNAVLVREAETMKRREDLYRDGRPAIDITHRPVIIVDDGIATGSSLIAATRHARNLRALKVIAAVPVGSQEGCARIRHEAEGAVCICLAMPADFTAVGQWYLQFSQVSDDTVRSLLSKSRQRHASAAN
jgi:putative phosphoribosyl transferase